MRHDLQENIENVWRILGTTTAPHANRESIIDVINLYLNAVVKVNEANIFKKSFKDFFSTYSSTSSFQFIIKTENSNLEVTDLIFHGDDHEHLTDMSCDIYDLCHSNQKVIEYFYNSSWCSDYTITKESYQDIIDNILSSEEREIFYGIENFEKHKLEKTLAVKSKNNPPKI